MLRSKRTLTVITRRRAAFAANKVAQIVALGLLYTLILVTQFSIFLANGHFSQSGSRVSHDTGPLRAICLITLPPNIVFRFHFSHPPPPPFKTFQMKAWYTFFSFRDSHLTILLRRILKFISKYLPPSANFCITWTRHRLE